MTDLQDAELSTDQICRIGEIVATPKYEFSIVAFQAEIIGRGIMGQLVLDGFMRSFEYWEDEQIRDPSKPKRGFISYYNEASGN